MGIAFSADDEFAEAAEEFGLLRGRVRVGILPDCDATAVALHVKVADIRLEVGLLDLEAQLGSVIRKDKIPDRNVRASPDGCSTVLAVQALPPRPDCGVFDVLC